MTNNQASTIKKQQHNSDEALAKNLSYLLEKENLSISEFSDILDIPQMTIRRLLSGETADPRISTLKLIANYFGVPVDYLLESNKQASIASVKYTKPFFVPMLDWSTTEKIFSQDNELNLDNVEKFCTVSQNCAENLSEKSFALESCPSLYPLYPKGTVFIIDQMANPTDGDIVLVRIEKTYEITLRKLAIYAPEWILESLIKNHNSLTYSETEYKILGVVMLTIFYNRIHR
jgi:transcriptional regulator with XRE-family HTH domain